MVADRVLRQRARPRISRALRETDTVSGVPDTSTRPPRPFREHVDEAVPIARSVSQRLSYGVGRSVAAVEKEHDRKTRLRAGGSLRQVVLVDPAPAIDAERNLGTARRDTRAIRGLHCHRDRRDGDEERNDQSMKAHDQKFAGFYSQT